MGAKRKGSVRQLFLLLLLMESTQLEAELPLVAPLEVWSEPQLRSGLL